MTPPNQEDRNELINRTAQFRMELSAVGERPSRAALEKLIDRARELGLGESDVSDELSQIDAALEAIDLRSRIERGELPVAMETAASSGEPCRFHAPVRFGRRRADQFGHLLMTDSWLRFRGAVDVSIVWSEVDLVRREGHEIVVGLRESRRMLRFWCQSYSEAAVGEVIAQSMMRAARADDEPASGDLHATV